MVQQRIEHDLKVAAGVCWNTTQLAQIIDQYDGHSEIIKCEITHDFSPGKKCYRWMIFFIPVPDECDDTGSDVVPGSEEDLIRRERDARC